MYNPCVNFDPETLPWLDKYIGEIEQYVADSDVNDPAELRRRLTTWLQQGFIVLEQVVPHSLIDQYTESVEAFLRSPNDSGVRLTVEGFGTARAADLPPEAFSVPHLRVMDFHNASRSGKQLSLLPVIVEVLQHVFRDRVVAMQTLTFRHSTEQSTHQDFPYVVSGIMSHLAATWIPLEDVHPDAGPLFYYPGSHHIPKFDWGNGLALTSESRENPQSFADYLENICESYGLARVEFTPRKGDVLFWHAGLVHGGGAVRDRSLTRKSFVTHYSTATAYPLDRRSPSSPPEVIEMNGGIIYVDPLNAAEEDRYP